MVKVLELRSGRIRDYEKRYVDIMVKLGHVSIIKEPEPIVEKVPEPQPAPAAIETVNEWPAGTEMAVKPKRVYKRRDMKAENEE